MSLAWALSAFAKSAVVMAVFLGAALGFALLLRFVFSLLISQDPYDQSEATRLLRDSTRRPREIRFPDCTETEFPRSSEDEGEN